MPRLWALEILFLYFVVDFVQIRTINVKYIWKQNSTNYHLLLLYSHIQSITVQITLRLHMKLEKFRKAKAKLKNVSKISASNSYIHVRVSCMKRIAVIVLRNKNGKHALESSNACHSELFDEWDSRYQSPRSLCECMCECRVSYTRKWLL